MVLFCMCKCTKLGLKIDGLVIFTALQGCPVSTLIHDISFVLLETLGRTISLSAMNFGDGASAQSIPIGFKIQCCLCPP